MAVQIKERSYFLWLFLSIITFGICGIIYIYYTMDDLNKLYAKHGKGEAVSVVLVFVLMILGFGSLVYMFLIYEKLHEHIESKHGKYNVPGGLGIILWNIFLGWTIFVPLYFGWKWQNALNIQIRGKR
ncbi:MAG TPA: DUF4234 domain-containing protein [candidate division Zixibacteria bacterium]|nr:DUF4234 domain-containing protein [candidate division Zixibacteria bacterium]